MSAEFIEMNKLESASNIYDKFQSGVLPLQASSEDACVNLLLAWHIHFVSIEVLGQHIITFTW
jgi:hypothetical protein